MLPGGPAKNAHGCRRRGISIPAAQQEGMLRCREGSTAAELGGRVEGRGHPLVLTAPQILCLLPHLPAKHYTYLLVSCPPQMLPRAATEAGKHEQRGDSWSRAAGKGWQAGCSLVELSRNVLLISELPPGSELVLKEGEGIMQHHAPGSHVGFCSSCSLLGISTVASQLSGPGSPNVKQGQGFSPAPDPVGSPRAGRAAEL